jgi:hypothetical protein
VTLIVSNIFGPEEYCASQDEINIMANNSFLHTVTFMEEYDYKLRENRAVLRNYYSNLQQNSGFTYSVQVF